LNNLACWIHLWDHDFMTPVKIKGGFPPEVRAEIEEAIRRALTGVRDPEIMRRACERTDRIREEIRKNHGTLDIGVPAIRGLRGELPKS
jgi:hypothetical protein